MPQQTWTHNLIRSTQNKRSSRSGTPLRSQDGGEVAYELIGVDGREEGGAKLFPGFESAIAIDPETAWEGSLESGVTSPGTPTSTWLAESFRSVLSFRIGDGSFGYGIVYRLSGGNEDPNAAGNDEHLFIQYRRNAESAWQVRHLTWFLKPGTLWDVEVFGSLVYVFVEGQNPILFYVTEDTSTSTFTEVQVGGDNSSSGVTTGPGEDIVVTTPSESGAETLGELGDPASGSAHAQVALPASTSSGVETTIQPSATNEQDPGWTKLFDDGSGGYDGPQEDDDVAELEPGEYVVAFQLSDSVTGRRSQLSEVVEIKPGDFPQGDTSLSESDLRPGVMALEIVYDPALWDTARIYRSVDVQGSSALSTAFKLLDNVITLADHQISDQGTNDGGSGASGDITAGFSKAVYWYEATDAVLASQTPYLDSETFDENMPPGGAALFYKNTMLVSSISGSANDPDALNSLGEVRYSALSFSSPELFAPSARFVPTLVTDAVERFAEVNDSVIGFTPNRMRFIRRDGTSLAEPRNLHSGFGITGARAVEVVGGQAFYVSAQGVKTVDSRATLDSLHSADHVISEEWRGSLASVSMAYDGMLQALFILSPENEEALVFWFNKTRMTTLLDMNFRGCERGAVPEDPSDTTTPLRERALFLFSRGGGSGGQHEVMVVAADKAPGGKRNMLPITGDSVLTFQSRDTSFVSRLQFSGSPTLSDDMVGRKIYVLQAADKSQIGKGETITAKVSSNQLDTQLNAELQAGDKLGVSPVPFRWVSPPLPTFGPDGRVIPDEGLVRLVVGSVRPTFSGVQGDAADTIWATFRGLVYRRDENQPLGEGVPITNNGDGRQGVNEGIANVAAGVSPSRDEAIAKGVRGQRGVAGSGLSVGVEIVTPDLDFTVISARTDGRITREDTDTRVREDDG